MAPSTKSNDETPTLDTFTKEWIADYDDPSMDRVVDDSVWESFSESFADFTKDEFIKLNSNRKQNLEAFIQKGRIPPRLFEGIQHNTWRRIVQMRSATGITRMDRRGPTPLLKDSWGLINLAQGKDQNTQTKTQTRSLPNSVPDSGTFPNPGLPFHPGSLSSPCSSSNSGPPSSPGSLSRLSPLSCLSTSA